MHINDVRSGMQMVATASSSAKNLTQAVTELRDGVELPDLCCVLFFCSAEFEREALSNCLSDQFNHIPLLGCTSADALFFIHYKYAEL